MANYVIGDIHGSYQTLKALLAHIDFQKQRDTLWFVGDLVNRGAQSLEVLEFIMGLPQAHVAIGNHGIHLLTVAAKVRPLGNKDTFTDVLNSPRCQIICDWLREQSICYIDRTKALVLVHAGLPGLWSMSTIEQRALEVEHQLKQSNYATWLAHFDSIKTTKWHDDLSKQDRCNLLLAYFTYMRFCDENGHMEFSQKGHPHQYDTPYIPWYQLFAQHHQGIKVCFGHWSTLKGDIGIDDIQALDTGCAWGGQLSAWHIETSTRFSVPAIKRTA